MTEKINIEAPKVLDIIKSAERILLHCHPGPDPDSVGSALAMKFALESLGKKVVVIRGDGPMPESFSHFLGFETIANKDLSGILQDMHAGVESFDLFIILDSASMIRITQVPNVTLPATLKTLVIDHHQGESGFPLGYNLVDTSYPATAMLLYDLFSLWNITLTPSIAANLFIGIYADTGGFRYAGVGSEVFAAAAKLAAVYPQFHEMIFKMDNNKTPAELTFEGLALDTIETFNDGHLALAAVSLDMLTKAKMNPEDASASYIATKLRSVKGWDVGVCCVETELSLTKISFRTRDASVYDLSKIAASLGGGGHRAAAAAIIKAPFSEVKKRIVDAVMAYKA